MQFSLKWLLLAVAFVAVSLVALINANHVWRIGLRSAVLLTVLVAIAGAAWSVGKTRAFCGGYALFALSYLTSFFGFPGGSELISTNLLETIHASAFAPTTERVGLAFQPTTYFGDVLTVTHQRDGTLLVTAIRPKRQEFVAVGHAVLSTALGLLGGLVAARFYSRRPQQAESLSLKP